ncbi:MAG TPA: transglutaminase family protein [Propionibacteriaceae bacterium]|nr:transglutaminase family protein [Propionibacteriaceae bacterium]
MRAASEKNHQTRRYKVKHRTDYTYDEEVTASYGRAVLRPRDTPTQRVIRHLIEVTPTPNTLLEHVDFFGNYSHYLEIHTPHRQLDVTKHAVVNVATPMTDLARFDRWTVGDGAAAAAAAPYDTALRAAFTLPSALVDQGDAVRRFAAEAFPSDAPLGRALDHLVSFIHAEFRYTPGATTVHTTLPELLDARAGVCQDFAQLAIGCLRAQGYAARYVSGYLETQPPPGQPKLEGADATHAWLAVMLPDGTWLDLDPTNDCAADSRYVVTAWGRDYRDVAPLKGVIYSEGASSSLKVSVDVTRLPD